MLHEIVSDYRLVLVGLPVLHEIVSDHRDCVCGPDCRLLVLVGLTVTGAMSVGQTAALWSL